MSTIEIISNVIVPIFIIVGVSMVADRTLALDSRSLSRLIVYVFSPCLVLDGIANSNLSGSETGGLLLVALLVSLLIAGVAWCVARLLKLDRMQASAFMLTAVVINAGNYGIPLNKFAFGDQGEACALIFFVMTVVISNTLGVFLASCGAVSTRRALLNVLKVPMPYAAVLGFAINLANVDLPLAIQRSTSLLGQAAIPGMLVVLGVQLSRASVRGRIKPIVLAASMRLVVAPLLALPVTVLIGLHGLSRDVAIVQSSMPTAVMGGVLATEFNSDSVFVTAVILVSTLASMGTLTVLLSLLM